jgi:cell division protein FtsB
MENKSKERKKFPILAAIFVSVLISAGLSFFLGQSGVLRLQELRDEYEKIRMENYKLALENKKTAQEIRELKTNPDTVEKIAREEMHYVSPHDVVLVVPEDTAKSDSEKTAH